MEQPGREQASPSSSPSDGPRRGPAAGAESAVAREHVRPPQTDWVVFGVSLGFLAAALLLLLVAVKEPRTARLQAL